MKLTKEILWNMGFHSEGRDIINRPAYRLKDFGDYVYGEIQVVLMDLPATNPNCGIVSIHQPEMKDQHLSAWVEGNDKKEIEKKMDFVEQVDKDGITYGIKYVTFPAKTFPIASGVYTVERLQEIIKALTGKEIKYKP